MVDVIVRLLNALLMVAIPLVLGVGLTRKFAVGWRLFGIGALTFIASQVFHIPFNTWVLNPLLGKLGLSITQSGLQLLVVAILYGLSAGIFEEIARYLVYRFRLKSDADRTWERALMFGTGHGGIEAIIFGILAGFSFFRLLAFRDADLSALIPANQLSLAKEQVELYWSLPWYGALLGAVERAFAISFHLSATVLVLQAFKRKNILWLWAAIFSHTVLDAVAVYAGQTWNMYVTEALIGVFAVISLVIVFLLREPKTFQDERIPEKEFNLQEKLENQELSTEKLEDSRYV